MKKYKRNLKDSMELSKNIKILGMIFKETTISSLQHKRESFLPSTIRGTWRKYQEV